METITEPYVPTEGARVISSFNPSNATPENSALAAAGTAAAMSVGEMLLLRGSGKLLLGEYGVGAAGEKVYASDGIVGAKGSAFAGKNIDDLSNAGKLLDPAYKSGQLSLAGRALQKHGSREGSAFPSVKGSPSEINAQGQKIADEILSNPATTVTYKDTGRFGKVMDVIAPDGRGLRYDSNGKFIGLLEPPKP